MLFAAKPANSVELKPLIVVLTEEDSAAMAVDNYPWDSRTTARTGVTSFRLRGIFCWGFYGPKQTLLGMFGAESVENLDNILDHHLLSGHAPLIDGQANLFP